FPSRHPPAPTARYTLSLHDALPISSGDARLGGGRSRDGHIRADLREALFTNPADQKELRHVPEAAQFGAEAEYAVGKDRAHAGKDRKSTRLNSSHVKISYAVFCLKK